MALISVVVPIYNVEQYLHRSIESLRKQTLKDIEIILVNDGSNDRSFEICKKYSEIDERIVVVDKPNGGVSTARNLGMNIARGDYISFVDPDDYIEENMYENMYSKIIEDKSDACIANYIIQKSNHSIKVNHNISSNLLSSDEIIKEIITFIISGDDIGKVGKLTGFRSTWVFLYKKSIIQKNNIMFLDGLPIGEDFLFNLNFLLKSNKIAIDNGHYYHYCTNQESITKRYIKNYYEYHKILISNIEQIIKDNKLNVKLEKRICIMKINYLVAGIVNEFHKYNVKSNHEKIKSIRMLITDSTFYEALEQYDHHKLSLFRKIWFIMLKNKIIPGIYIYYKLRV